MRQWQWHAPPGWPSPPPGLAPDTSFAVDVENWPAVPPQWQWWKPVGGQPPADEDDFNRIGHHGGSFLAEPPAPKEPPLRWVPAPGWPPVPDGWVPPAGWRPSLNWPRAPFDWQFWQPDHRPNERAYQRWYSDRTAYFEQNLATVAGAQLMLHAAESCAMWLRAAFYLHCRPLPSTVQCARADLPAWQRQEHANTYRHGITALVALRDRLFNVITGTATVESAQLVLAASNARQHTRACTLSNVTALKRELELAIAVNRRLNRSELLEHLVHENRARSDRAETWAWAPSQQLRIDSWQDAEAAAAHHMRTVLELTDATLSPAGADQGIDVTSSTAVAQVKHLSRPVGRPDLQRLVGANEGPRRMLFYSTSGYSREAIAYADRLWIALFQFVPPDPPIPINRTAEKLI